MDRSRKEELVAELHDAFANTALVVITHQTGLTVEEATRLRRRMYEVGAKFRVTKNRLAKIAIKGTRYEGLTDTFTGPTAVVFSGDPVAAAKVAVDFANENERFTIVGGGLGEHALGKEGIEALAKLPSLDELRGRIVGLLQAPAGKLAGVIQAPVGKLAGVINASAAKLPGVLRAYAAKA